jgi:hypothetical protein
VLGDEDTFEDEDLLDIPILDNTKHFEIFRFEIKNLADLCLAGIAFREFAGPAFVDVVEELKQFRNVQNKPILIAIDQMNFWDMKTIYKYQNKPIASTQLCVPYVTKFISYKKSENFSNSTQGTGNGTQGNGTQGTGNGSQGSHVFYLGATTNYYPISKKELVTYVDSRSSLPLSIHVPCYSHVEYLAACKLYFNTKILDHGLTNQQLLAYRIHVSNNPRLTRRDATRFFMPIYSKYATTAFLNYVNCAGAGAGAAGEEMNEEMLQEEADENDYYGLSSVKRSSDGEEGFADDDAVIAGDATEAAAAGAAGGGAAGGEDGSYDQLDHIDEENLFNLPEGSLENDYDLTKMSEKEVEEFFEMIGEDEEIDELVADELPLPERDLEGKDIKRIARDDE